MWTDVRLHLIRHAEVTPRPERPGPSWHLSSAGREAAEHLGAAERWASCAAVFSSPEPKAVATAQRIAAPHELPLRIDRDLREVDGRPWSDDYRADVQRYLAGEALAGWEARDEALARMRQAVARIADAGEEAAIASHGLVLTLYLADLGALDADATFALWSSIRFPDVALVDIAAGRVLEAFGASG